MYSVFVGNVGVFEVHPVAHLFGQLVPLVGELHHGLAALAVVFFDGDLLADVLLGDAQFFSTCNSMGRPWVSQPPLRFTWKP
jgi:hypothetical protein